MFSLLIGQFSSSLDEIVLCNEDNFRDDIHPVDDSFRSAHMKTLIGT